MSIGLVTALNLAPICSAEEQKPGWKKHVVMQRGHCNTAVALDANGDAALDVIASFNGRVSLFLAPDWRETVIHRFPGAEGGEGAIHSEVIDVDGDGDMDWAGTLSHASPIWLENPGREKLADAVWIPRLIDHDIVGIHCIPRADIDNDGRDDLVINNFEPDKGLGDSMAWFSIPKEPLTAERWNRHIFADKDARGGSHYMGVGDIDGDGDGDLLNAGRGSGNVVWYENPRLPRK